MAFGWKAAGITYVTEIPSKCCDLLTNVQLQPIPGNCSTRSPKITEGGTKITSREKRRDGSQIRKMDR